VVDVGVAVIEEEGVDEAASVAVAVAEDERELTWHLLMPDKHLSA